MRARLCRMRPQWRSLLLVALLVACESAYSDPNLLPDWLEDLIERLESEPVANPPASIARWEYAAGVFYYLPPRCCDIYSDLYDSEGTLLCHPDGGITGGGDGRCPALGDRIREEIVWRDPRG